MSSSEKQNVYDIVTDRLLALLEHGVVPWQKPWTQRDDAGALITPRNLASGRAYRGINVFLLGCMPYQSPYWVSFKQALDLGGNVRKGEKSSLAIFWKMLEVDRAEGDTAEGKKRIPMLRYYNVFNVEQCDGLEYPKPAAAPAGPAFTPIETAARIVRDMPLPPTITHREPRACYRPISDTVNMPAPELFKQPAEYYSVLFHELAHSTGHAARLARPGITELNAFGSQAYGREELVAEMTASFLSAEAGILHRTIENSAAYLDSWIKVLKEDRKAAVIAAAQAQKASDYVLGRLATQQQEHELAAA